MTNKIINYTNQNGLDSKIKFASFVYRFLLVKNYPSTSTNSLSFPINHIVFPPPNKHRLIKFNSRTQTILAAFYLHFFSKNKIPTFQTQVLIKMNPILANFFVLVLWQNAYKPL